MELAHTITLNEEALAQNAEQKRPIFVLEWLRFVDKNLATTPKSVIKECQKKLVDQLMQQIQNSPGPPTRKFLARCMATLFSIGDTFLLFEAVNKCNDILKNKEDSQSFMLSKLAAIACIGEMFGRLGRLMGRSYEDTVSIVIKMLKSAESQTRCEIYLTLEKIVAGMGAAAGSVHRDIFKTLRHGVTDRVMSVRSAAAGCLKEMIPHATFLYTTDLESVFSMCFRALDGSNYEVRCAIADALGCLVATTQTHTAAVTGGKARIASLEDVLNLLSSGFLKGGIGFLKSGATEMIKGSSTVTREVRVGVTHAYVAMIKYLGNAWLEKNMSVYISHLLDMLTNPKASASHMDAVYSRRCVIFILSSVLGKELSEKAQSLAIKELVSTINRYINTPAAVDNETKDFVPPSNDALVVQHVLICAITEIGCLIEQLGTCSVTILAEPSVGVIDTIVSVLTHPASGARLAAAWCLRCIVVAAPSHLTPLIERSLERLETMKSSADTIYGYSAALAALLGATSQTPLGIPHNKGKLIFNIAEDLLRSASQNSRLSLQRTQAGWLLIGAVMTLGPPVVRGLLPRMLLLWKNSFPRSAKELESEKARGDAFTWQVTLENRAGALSAMASFLTHCEKLVTDEVVRRLATPIESAINMLTTLSSVFKNQGPSVKVATAMVRLRLFEVLLLLPSECFEASYTSLLRLVVTEFTLADTAANTTTSLLRTLCHADDDVILGTWIQETDHKLIEDQLQPNCASGSSALEHDITALYVVPNCDLTGPYPLGVAVIDKSSQVFAHIFRHISNKHKIQMIGHFTECIKHAKAARQEAVQMNVLTAVLGSLRSLAEHKVVIDNQEIKNACISLLSGMLSHGNAIIRCAAAQSLGRCGQIMSDGKAVVEIAQMCFDKVKVARDAASRTGHSFALGCLHRHAGSLGSSQHLNTTISILLALSQDNASPIVQAWALQSLTLIADSGGPAFRSYVEPCLSQSQRLLMNAPSFHADVHQCIGKLLAAVVTTVGPELQSNASNAISMRSVLLLNCAIMQEHSDPLVRTEAISCLQQLHMFAPQHLCLSDLVPILCSSLGDEHLFLRRAAANCLHQLSQREAQEVNDHALAWARQVNKSDHGMYSRSSGLRALAQSDHGLTGMLFSMLDRETDAILRNYNYKTIKNLVQTLATVNLHKCISLCKEVLTASDSNSNLSSPDKEMDGEDGYADDESRFKAGDDHATHPSVPPKWKTKVCATETLCRIIVACERCPDSAIHFDLVLAREHYQASKGKNSFLVLHLADLIRMTFMTATSDSDPLRLEGLKALQLVIDKFAKVPEPEFPNHVILEQYQAQVGAALRPAFTPDTPSHVTAVACQVCSAWIGSGVARDLNDLRRVHQLLVSSLAKLQKDSSSRQYNEGASTLEKLAILKAWAEVYVVAMDEEQQLKARREQQLSSSSTKTDEELPDEQVAISSSESLSHLVIPELRSLSNYWLSALKDHALLTLPPEFSTQLPHDGGAFYTSDTVEMAKPRYRSSWPQILHAAALWLCTNDFKSSSELDNANSPPPPAENGTNSSNSSPHDKSKDNFYLLFGICMEALCNPKSTDPYSNVIVCLKSLHTLLSHHFPRSLMAGDKQLAIELASVLHRLLITRETPSCQILVIEISQLIAKAFHEHFSDERKKLLRELAPANQKPDDETHTALALIGEGEESGEIVPGKSVVYSLLEIALCVLVRQLPDLSPVLTDNSLDTNHVSAIPRRLNWNLSEESTRLVSSSLKLITCLPELCSPKGTVAILPSILFLLTGVYKEVITRQANSSSASEPGPMSTILECLETLCASPFASNSICGSQWVEILQSTLARILDLHKTSDEQLKPDQVTALLTIGLFVTKAPSKVVKPPNLQFPCINLLKQSLQSGSDVIQIKCSQTLQLIFRHDNASVSYPYIQALAPRVIELLTCETGSQLSGISKEKHDILMSLLSVLETLIEIAESSKKIDLLTLYVPILINLLTENLELIKGKSYRSSLHYYALKKLIAIGPTYPQEFRQIVSQSPAFRTKLETAVRNQHNNVQHANSLTNESRQQSTRNENPIIKLKTDFSNYSQKR